MAPIRRCPRLLPMKPSKLNDNNFSALLNPFVVACALLTVAASLSSCALSAPAVAKTERGEMFMGTITASLVSGNYELSSIDGKTIKGTYNPYNMSKSRIFEFRISDGRTGKVIVNSISDVSGWGMGKLSTGEKCKFMYGTTAVAMDFSMDF